MANAIQALTALVNDLGHQLTLEDRLQLVADRAAELLATPRVSVRLLDSTRTQLISSARAGKSLHRANVEFKLGEGLLGWIASERKPIRTADADNDRRFAKRATQIEKMGSFVGVPILVGHMCIGVLSAVNQVPDYFTADHEQMLTLVAGMCAPHLEIARLQRLAQVDSLTGALNRRGLDQMFPEVSPRPGQLKDGFVRPLSVVMVDIDHFKRVNDEHGHEAGDEVLRRVALLLSGVLRIGDAVIRYGGEEFLLILPGADIRQGERVAERARLAVETRSLAVGGKQIRITISLGVAERRDDETREAFIRRADLAMYLAKRGGRNRVECAP